jgi:hypothetical protein
MNIQAPKGRDNKAQANGLGQQDPNQCPSPEGAEQYHSIPNVPFVADDCVRVQQFPEFILKAGRTVMPLLLRNIFDDFFHVRPADRKRAVAALPMEVRQSAPLRLEPFRRTGLHFLHDFCQREILRQSKQGMNVVARASDYKRRGVLLVENRREVGVKIFPHGRQQHWFAMFRTEDQVNVELRKGLRHGGNLFRPFRAQGWKGRLHLDPGRWPGLCYFAPLGLLPSVGRP